MKNIIKLGLLCLFATACGGQSMNDRDGSGNNTPGDAGEPGSTGGSSTGGSSGTGNTETGGTGNVAPQGGASGTGGSQGGEGGSSDMDESVCGPPITDACIVQPGDARNCDGDRLCECADGSDPSDTHCVRQDGLSLVHCACPSTGTGGSSTGGSAGTGGSDMGGEGGTGGDETEAALTIELHQEIPDRIVHYGGVVPSQYASYLARNNTDQDISIRAVTFGQAEPEGKMTSFGDVALGNPWGFGGVGKRPTHADEEITFDGLGSGWLLVPANGTFLFPVGYAAPQLLAPSSAAGPDSPQSGDVASLEIRRATATSTDGAEVEVAILPSPAPRIVLRKSVLSLNKAEVASTELVDGTEMELFKLQANPDWSGTVALKQLRLFVQKSAGPALAAVDMRVLKGAVDMGLDAWVRAGAGGGPAEGQIPSLSSAGAINIGFMSEEIIFGSGSVYTLVGKVTGVSSGSTLEICLTPEREREDPVITGSIYLGPGIFMLGDDYHNVLWSDLSEVPHSFITPSSLVWTNGYRIVREEICSTFTAP